MDGTSTGTGTGAGAAAVPGHTDAGAAKAGAMGSGSGKGADTGHARGGAEDMQGASNGNAQGGDNGGNTGTGQAGGAGSGAKDARLGNEAGEQAGNVPEGEKGPEGLKENQQGDNTGQEHGDALQWRDLARHLPENADIDPAMVEDFAKFAQGLNLQPEQARQLVDWQLKAVAQAQDRVMKAGMEELAREWGRDTQKNLADALGAAAWIDRKLGGEEFSKACGRYGIACDKAFVRGMHAVAQLLAEDSLGANHGQAAPVKTETAFEALKDMFK